eukprot:CCRYP_009247-RA/>CCRYP_009247-RA protein AED:0.49 eAED:0.54 QI:0/0/0/1/0/0/3/0/319
MNNNKLPRYTDLNILPIPTQHICLTAGVPSTTPSYSTDDFAIVDSGASDNYFTPTANVQTKTTLHHPIQVTLPDQSTLRSSHKCELDIPLPKTAKRGYIIPGMKNHSLISVAKMCDAGCKVIFSNNECHILHSDTIIMTGRKNKHNGLWYIPLQQSLQDTPFTIYNNTTLSHHGNSVYHTTTLANTFINVCFHQQYIPSAKPSTMISLSASADHIYTVKKHTRSTTHTRQANIEAINQDFRPTINSGVDFELFVGRSDSRTKRWNTIHRSDSNKYQFVAYEYRSNAILVRALKDQTDKSLTAAFAMSTSTSPAAVFNQN